MSFLTRITTFLTSFYHILGIPSRAFAFLGPRGTAFVLVLATWIKGNRLKEENNELYQAWRTREDLLSWHFFPLLLWRRVNARNVGVLVTPMQINTSTHGNYHSIVSTRKEGFGTCKPEGEGQGDEWRGGGVGVGVVSPNTFTFHSWPYYKPYLQPEQLFQHDFSMNFGFFVHSPFLAQSAQCFRLSTHGAVQKIYIFITLHGGRNYKSIIM